MAKLAHGWRAHSDAHLHTDTHTHVGYAIPVRTPGRTNTLTYTEERSTKSEFELSPPPQKKNV